MFFFKTNVYLISKTPQQSTKIGAIDASFINKSGKYIELYKYSSLVRMVKQKGVWK